MRHARGCVIASLLLLVAAASARADGTVHWSRPPAPGKKLGEIVVGGKAVPSKGYKLEAAQIHYWPACGGVGKTAKIKLNKDGTFKGTVSGLTSCAFYNVRVEVAESNGSETDELSSDVELVAAR